jgi:hypothetical protein
VGLKSHKFLQYPTFSIQTLTIDWLELICWERIAEHDSSSHYFLRVLYFDFWLGIISPHSLEVGFGYIIVPWDWLFHDSNVMEFEHGRFWAVG